jgi:hypothetical protein
VNPDLAERLVIFTPLGFSSVYLDGAKLPTTYRVVGTDGKQGPEQRLNGEPTFRAARARALKSTPEELFAIASRCAMVNVVAQMVDDITNLDPDRIKDIVFTPAAVFIPRFSPPPSKAKKPWWRLW